MRRGILAIAAVLMMGMGVWAAEPPGAVGPEASLLEMLRGEASLEQKAEACRQLERVGTRAAVPVLAKLLSDERMAHKARMALEQIGDASVNEALREAMGKLQGRLLAGVVQSIGHRHDAKATKALAKLLKSDDAEVASSAAYALGMIGTGEAAAALEQAVTGAREEVRPAVWDGLLRAAESLASHGRREKAASLYDRIRESNAPVQVRIGAARGAVIARQEDGVALLGELLCDKDLALFTAALGLAAEVPGEAVTRAIASGVQKLPADRQAVVVTVLGNRGDKTALAEIRAALKSGDAQVRVAAIAASAQMKDAASLGAILEAAGGNEKSVAEAAVAALVRLPGNEVDAALLEWVGAKDSSRQLIGIDCVARRQSAGAGAAMLKAMASGDGAVRLAAIKALGEVGTARELRPLVELLMKAEGAEKEAAEQAVLMICAATGEKDAAGQTLIDALAGAAKTEQKVTLLKALSSVGGSKALEAMRKAAGDANAEVQETAVRELCNWPTMEVAGDLMKLASSSEKTNYRILALRGWLRLAGDAQLPVEKRMEMCEQAMPLIQRPEEKRQWLGNLSAIGTGKSLGLIMGKVGDGTVREEACAAAVSVANAMSQAGNVEKAAVVAAMEQVKKTSRRARTVEAAEGVLRKVK